MSQFTQPPQQPQQPFPPQPAYPQYPQGYQMPPKTNTLAILSLVFAFLFAFVGSILGFIALSQISDPRRNETGKGLAIAGIIIGFLPVVVIVVLMLLGPAISSTFANITNSI
jgi:peptidyl-prolyl cis-trans isomerase B (cyclophilin B)